jgi:multiple sugar transport system substrate-binding protein
MRRFELKGITWNHSRALTPLVATAQRFEELNPEVRIFWDKRSLHEFGHAGLSELARSYDLLVVDHPMMGAAASSGALLDLRPLLKREEWLDLADDSAGPSFESYFYEGKLYALPIDAAAPAASLRPDLLTAGGYLEPTGWNEMLELARRGLVRMPAFPADLFLNFMGICVSRGSPVAMGTDHLFQRAIALQVLEEVRELASLMPEEIYRWNPITLYEQMASTDAFAYCPFAYTYSNYSRGGFAARHLRFTDTVVLDGGVPMHTVLGGTGLAISKSCAISAIALEYSLYVSGRICQGTLYGVCGGQPARRSAWGNDALNQLTDGFFQRTLSNIQRAFVRPRYSGYVWLQEEAGVPIIKYLREGGNAGLTLDHIDAMYRASLAARTLHA